MKQTNGKAARKVEKNTSKEQIELYYTIEPLLTSTFNEVKEFSKKKQDDPLNIKKVRMINRILEKAKEVLKNESTVVFLDLLDEDELPSNSDAVLTMSQFIAAMNKFYKDHFHLGTWDEIEGDWD